MQKIIRCRCPPLAHFSCASNGQGCSRTDMPSMIQFKASSSEVTASPVPPNIRVSTGSAAVLGLKKVKVQALPKTIYLMNSGGCEYSCSFCSQGKHAASSDDKLSHVTWPEYPTENVLQKLEENQAAYKRICIQVVNTKDIFQKLPSLVQKIRKKHRI